MTAETNGPGREPTKATPREPTPEMINAGTEEFTGPRADDKAPMRRAWMAMYDAAPPAPAPEPDADALERFCPERKAACETPGECAGRESGCKMRIRMNIAPHTPAAEPCCGEWFTCQKPCTPRADRWREARNDELRNTNALQRTIEQQARELAVAKESRRTADECQKQWVALEAEWRRDLAAMRIDLATAHQACRNYENEARIAVQDRERAEADRDAAVADAERLSCLLDDANDRCHDTSQEYNALCLALKTHAGDTDGYEFGLGRVKFEHGSPVSFVWAGQDEIDAVIAAVRGKP